MFNPYGDYAHHCYGNQACRLGRDTDTVGELILPNVGRDVACNVSTDRIRVSRINQQSQTRNPTLIESFVGEIVRLHFEILNLR